MKKSMLAIIAVLLFTNKSYAFYPETHPGLSIVAPFAAQEAHTWLSVLPRDIRELVGNYLLYARTPEEFGRNLHALLASPVFMQYIPEIMNYAENLFGFESFFEGAEELLDIPAINAYYEAKKWANNLLEIWKENPLGISTKDKELFARLFNQNTIIRIIPSLHDLQTLIENRNIEAFKIIWPSVRISQQQATNLLGLLLRWPTERTIEFVPLLLSKGGDPLARYEAFPMAILYVLESGLESSLAILDILLAHLAQTLSPNQMEYYFQLFKDRLIDWFQNLTTHQEFVAPLTSPASVKASLALLQIKLDVVESYLHPERDTKRKKS